MAQPCGKLSRKWKKVEEFYTTNHTNGTNEEKKYLPRTTRTARMELSSNSYLFTLSNETKKLSNEII